MKLCEEFPEVLDYTMPSTGKRLSFLVSAAALAAERWQPLSRCKLVFYNRHLELFAVAAPGVRLLFDSPQLALSFYCHAHTLRECLARHVTFVGIFYVAAETRVAVVYFIHRSAHTTPPPS